MQTLIQSSDLVHQALLPVDKITPSATNPRKRITDEMIEELAASVAKVGVLQPILVRQHEQLQGSYEIVAGECCYRAAVKAGLETIPATIRDLTDLEALELQVLENLHRNDLHPLEEAEGFQQLLDANGYTVATLDSKIGKSKAYVYASLKLCELCQAGREAFYDGKLTASTALLIARIPGEKLQVQAVEEITTPAVYYGGIPSYRDAAKIIQRQFTTNLDDAIFDEADPDLVPEAGSCIDCPKLSGNSREIFPDIKSADVCTDTACFQAKRQAHIARLKALPDTIHGDEAKKILTHSWSIPQSSDYIRESKQYSESRKWTELLGNELPTRTLVLDEGDPVVLIDVVAAKKMLKEKGIQLEPEKEREPSPYEIERRERMVAQEAEQARRVALLAAFHQQLADGAMLKKTITICFPIMIASLFSRLNSKERELFFGARNEEDWLPSDRSEWEWRISELFQKDQQRLLLELFSSTFDDGSALVPYYSWNPGDSNEAHVFNAILSAAGIDPASNPGEIPTDPASAAHADEKVACAEKPDAAKTAAHAGEPDGEDQGPTSIQAASAASKRAAKNPAAKTAAEAE